MFDAEQQNVILKGVDVKYMENYKAMQQIKDFEDISKMDGNKAAAANFLKGNGMKAAGSW